MERVSGDVFRVIGHIDIPESERTTREQLNKELKQLFPNFSDKGSTKATSPSSD